MRALLRLVRAHIAAELLVQVLVEPELEQQLEHDKVGREHETLH